MVEYVKALEVVQNLQNSCFSCQFSISMANERHENPKLRSAHIENVDPQTVMIAETWGDRDLKICPDDDGAVPNWEQFDYIQFKCLKR